MSRRVVVTGMGAVTPIGIGMPAFRNALREGLSGEGPILSFDSAGFPVKTAFEVKKFNGHAGPGARALDPFIRYALAAAAEALADARFETGSTEPERIGISVSSSKGGMRTLGRLTGRLAKHPTAALGTKLYSSTAPHFAAQWIARRWQIKGPTLCYIAACATGTMAILEGARLVRDGMADYCLAGASDASIVPLMLAAYRNMKALSKERMRPFDRRRDGFQVGEGAGLVFLETVESARARGAKIYGEILGGAYGSGISDPLHFEDKEDELARVLENLLKKSGITPEEVDYVNLHGTATRRGDLYETSQLKKFFGRRAYQIPMSATKSMTGHMLGASGAVEIIASLVAMNEGFVPPTVSLEKPDPACDLDYTAGQAREQKVETALSLSMGFGGHIAAIAMRRAI